MSTWRATESLPIQYTGKESRSFAGGCFLLAMSGPFTLIGTAFALLGLREGNGFAAFGALFAVVGLGLAYAALSEFRGGLTVRADRQAVRVRQGVLGRTRRFSMDEFSAVVVQERENDLYAEDSEEQPPTLFHVELEHSRDSSRNVPLAVQRYAEGALELGGTYAGLLGVAGPGSASVPSTDAAPASPDPENADPLSTADADTTSGFPGFETTIDESGWRVSASPDLSYLIANLFFAVGVGITVFQIWTASELEPVMFSSLLPGLFASALPWLGTFMLRNGVEERLEMDAGQLRVTLRYAGLQLSEKRLGAADAVTLSPTSRLFLYHSVKLESSTGSARFGWARRESTVDSIVRWVEDCIRFGPPSLGQVWGRTK